MPDSGIVHFEMIFPPMPADTHILHFTEGQNNDYAWKLCNIRERKEDLQSTLPTEWQDITYAQTEMLPTSAFCDDSTNNSSLKIQHSAKQPCAASTRVL